MGSSTEALGLGYGAQVLLFCFFILRCGFAPMYTMYYFLSKEDHRSLLFLEGKEIRKEV